MHAKGFGVRSTQQWSGQAAVDDGWATNGDRQAANTAPAGRAVCRQAAGYWLRCRTRSRVTR